MYGNQNRLLVKESLKLGVQRLRDYFGSSDPLSRKQRQQLIEYVRKHAGPVMSRVRRRGIDIVLCTSGTHLTLGLCCLRLRGRDPWGSLNGYVIRSSELHDLASTLLDQEAAERTRLPGIDERRADTVHFGGAVLMTLLEMARAREFQLCGASLREGLLLREIERLYRKRPAPNARIASAFDLIRRAGSDPARARHLADLAVAIFDGSRRAHGLTWRDRELLETAALLEDVGRGLHLHDREHLSYQIIRGGGLRGLSDVELEIVGMTARYSRGGAPKARHRHFAELDPESQHIVRVLAGILRIADGLDRGRAGAVKSVRCRLSAGVLRITPKAAGDASLEAWSAARATKLFAQSVDVDVVIVGAPAA
jgi:exopolyphosphatase/guanosine-5'-triphosphate,3'-diphosphate pyrophosphatase